MTSRMRSQSLGRMFVLSMFMGWTTSSLQSPSISGTQAASSSPVRAGERPWPSSAEAMVPPVATSRMFFMVAVPRGRAYVTRAIVPPHRVIPVQVRRRDVALKGLLYHGLTRSGQVPA